MFLKRFFAPEPLTDQKIIEAIQNDNESVLINVYERNFRKSKEFFLGFKANNRQVCEVLSKTIIFFWKEFQHYEAKQAPDIDQIIQYSARSYWLRKKQLEEDFPEFVNSEFDLKIPLDDPGDIHFNKKLNLLSSHLRMLSETSKKILYYTYFENLEDKKIAKILDLKDENEVVEIRNKKMRKYRNVLANNYVKRDLI